MNDALQKFHRKIQKYYSVIQCNASNQAIISTKSSRNISNAVNKVHMKMVLSENNIAMTKSYVCSAINDIVATTTNLIELLQ